MSSWADSPGRLSHTHSFSQTPPWWPTCRQGLGSKQERQRLRQTSAIMQSETKERGRCKINDLKLLIILKTNMQKFKKHGLELLLQSEEKDRNKEAIFATTSNESKTRAQSDNQQKKRTHFNKLNHNEEARQGGATRKGSREIAPTTQQVLHIERTAVGLSLSRDRWCVVEERTHALRQQCRPFVHVEGGEGQPFGPAPPSCDGHLTNFNSSSLVPSL